MQDQILADNQLQGRGQEMQRQGGKRKMKEKILLQAEKQACMERELRNKSALVQQYFSQLERRMHRKQRMWGGDKTVVTSETEGEPASYRRALAFKKVMEEMPITIEPWARIVGNSMEDETIVRCVLPSFLKKEELGKCTLNLSHKCPDFVTLLHTGIDGLLEKLEETEKNFRKKYGGNLPDSKELFLRTTRIELTAVLTLARRYQNLALGMADKETDPEQRENLLCLADMLNHVPARPASSFREAVQSVWLLNHIFRETMSYLSIGCIDRILYPYFEKDYLAGKITLQEAQELVDVFCLRVNDRAQLDPENYVVDQRKLEGAPRQCRLDYNFGFVSERETDEADAINHWGQNILISGIGEDGTDSTNVLTYLFLNAHEKFQMTDPTLTVRLHKNSPSMLLERVAEVLKTGGGMPYINNDDIIISAYQRFGVNPKDARNYANSNCWETLLQGCCNQEMIRGINFLYLLELALNRGKSFVYGADMAGQPQPDSKDPMSLSPWCGPVNGVIDGIDTGDVGNFRDIRDVMDAWKKQLDFMLETCVREFAEEIYRNGSHGPFSSNPLLSAMTKDCIDRLTDICHQGARYNLWHILSEAVSNAADAVAAIQKVVFEEQTVTLPQLVEILKNNWEGNQALQMKMIHEGEKFGNGQEQVDRLACEMVSYFVDQVNAYNSQYDDLIFSPCIATFSWIVNIGKRIGASADGRMSKEPIAANMSPVPSRDVSGPTAALNSYLKLDTASMAAGAPIDLRISLSGLEGEEGTRRIAAMIKTFIQMGGNMMTLTITSVEELRQAMESPEKYRGLRVRMGGWSAYYTLLSKESQKVHLKRVEHGLA